jgi:sarcosine oxidase, subunit gamma
MTDQEFTLPAAVRALPLIATSEMVQPMPPATRFVLRAAEAARAAAEKAFGVGLPVQACRAASAGERAALWLGPDEWLLLAPQEDACSELAAALAGLPHSLVDVSHRQSALCVTGPEAATLLAAGCPLDLAEHAFPVGMCTRTMCAKTEIVLWRPAREVFRVEVWRSFAAYLAQFLAEAARGMI